jgi:copper chaperone CopZ
MKTTIEIQGMHCASCEMLIKDVLEETNGVANAQVSRAHSNAMIEFDEKTVTKDQLCKLIKAEGYKAK